jgi:hypothetical protein
MSAAILHRLSVHTASRRQGGLVPRHCRINMEYFVFSIYGGLFAIVTKKKRADEELFSLYLYIM